MYSDQQVINAYRTASPLQRNIMQLVVAATAMVPDISDEDFTEFHAVLRERRVADAALILAEVILKRGTPTPDQRERIIHLLYELGVVVVKPVTKRNKQCPA